MAEPLQKNRSIDRPNPVMTVGDDQGLGRWTKLLGALTQFVQGQEVVAGQVTELVLPGVTDVEEKNRLTARLHLVQLSNADLLHLPGGLPWNIVRWDRPA